MSVSNKGKMTLKKKTKTNGTIQRHQNWYMYVEGVMVNVSRKGRHGGDYRMGGREGRSGAISTERKMADIRCSVFHLCLFLL